MHSAVAHFAPILAAEKSKVPFYIAGGLLALWAMVLSVGLGLRRADFPRHLTGERTIIAISSVLVLFAVSMAVVTSGSPAKAGEAKPAAGAAPGPPLGGQPSSGGSTAPSSSTPRATTGTPAPPSSPAPGAAGSTVKLAANPAGQLSFDTKQLSAKAGKLTIELTNRASLEHNVTIAQGTTTLGATPTFAGGARTLTITLARGTYTFFCSVPGHRQAGMEGTLSVS